MLWIVLPVSALTFTQAPTPLSRVNDSTWQTAFTVSDTTDVEVSIVNLRDSSIVRHLAAGLLGHNPPPPLAAGTLTQTLTWNVKDDFGKTVAHPESLSVRVRAGLTPKLDDFGAEDLFSFTTGNPTILPDKDGSLYILGWAGLEGMTFLRKYDASGNYLKTLFPPPSVLPSDSATGYGINLSGITWIPKTTNISQNQVLPALSITNSILNNTKTAGLAAFSDKDEIIVVSGTDKQLVSRSGGAVSGTQKFINGPAYVSGLTALSGETGPSGPYGPRYVTNSHDPKYLYLSGFFYGMIGANYSITQVDTSGFWGDGQVYKLNTQTGVATSWLKLASVPVLARDSMGPMRRANCAAIHGVAIDDSGRVFICDRLNRRIGVYDTNAVLLGSIPCAYPDRVAISKRTGAVYVITKRMVQYMSVFRLNKYPGWRGSPSPSISMQLDSTYTGDGDASSTFAVSLVLSESGNQTNILTAFTTVGIRSYVDNGGTIAVSPLFAKFARKNVPNFERIAVDRVKNRVYMQGYTIADWSNPVARKLTYSLDLNNLSAGPDGFLYAYCQNMPPFTYYGVSPIARFTLQDTVLKAANYSNTGTNRATPGCYMEWGMSGNSHRGIAVGWQGQIAAFISEASPLAQFTDTGCTDTTAYGHVDTIPAGGAKFLVKILNCTYENGFCAGREAMNCVKFDAAGNYYVGIRNSYMPSSRTDAITPSGLAADWAFSKCGAVVKFAPNATGTFTLGTQNSLTGQAKVYPQPFGPFADGTCNCRNNYFDVDPYGRLYVPCSPSAQVYIADNAGNNIAVIGQYGNTDSRGPLSGPGQPFSKPDVPLAWPTSVGASEDYVYVADIVNARVARVRMSYALDNIPGLTDASTQKRESGSPIVLALRADPDPFNPVSRIMVTLPSACRVDLSVYDIGGKLLRTLASGKSLAAGAHGFAWDAKDIGGRSVSSGVYVYRLTAGVRVMTLKTVYAR